MNRKLAVARPVRILTKKVSQKVQPLPVKYVTTYQKPTKKEKSSWEVLIFNDLWSAVQGTFSRPMVLLVMMLCFAIVIGHQTKFDESAVGKWVAKNKDNNTLAGWVKDNHTKFLGLIVFVPTLYDMPSANRLTVTLATLAWVYLVPERTVWEYVLQSFALHTYFRVKLNNTRFALILVVAVAWFLGWVKI